MRKKLLYAAGIFALIFSIFHILFWKLLNWGEQLQKLTAENRGVMEMLNVAVIYYLLFSAGITFYIARSESLNTLEKIIIVFFGGFYIMRILFGIPFFGINTEELTVWIACIIPSSCYFLALKNR